MIRRSGPFRRSDWYQGVELCWASLSLSVLGYYDLAKSYAEASTTNDEIVASLLLNTAFLIASLGATLWVASAHQDLETAPNTSRQILRLGIECNLLGSILIASFVVFVRTV